MRVFLLIASSIFIITSCSKVEDRVIEISSRQKYNYADGLKVAEIDSCEYIILDFYKMGGLTHKGNCRYCKERSVK